MKVTVTGGAGFIGSNLVSRLVRTGYRVTVIDNLLSGYRSNIETEPIEFIEGDIRDPERVGRAIDGAEVVFHLAASVGNKRSIDHPIDDAEINVIGTLRVLEACRRAGVRKIVASSSAGIFGELKTLPIREDHDVEPDSPYGCSKLYSEKACLSYAKLYPLEAVCLRYFNVYGPRQRYDAYGNVIPIFAHQILRDQPVTIFGDGEQTRDFISVHDVVEANIKAAESRGVSGAFNTGSGTRVTINELVKMLERAAGKRADVRYSPPRPGDVRHSLADISAARKLLGFNPSADFRTGLEEYIQWTAQEMRAE